MDENQTSHSSGWVIGITCSALVLLLATGVVFAMREQILVSVRAEARDAAKEREKLARRIDTLQTAVDTLSAQPKAEGASLEPFNSALAENNTSLAALNERVDVLEKAATEKKPEPVPAPVAAAATVVPPAPAVVAPAAAPTSDAERDALLIAARSGQPYEQPLAAWAKLHPDAALAVAPLNAFAATGIPTESSLTRALLDVIDKKPDSAMVEDTSLVGKINTHLKGLVRIKKATAPDPYVTLRADASHQDIESLTRTVERLGDAQRAPLEPWLKQAHARTNALEVLDRISPAVVR